jgi:excinuclease ABC subunit C
MSDFDAKTFLANTTAKPGVYCMHDSQGVILYVGKAKNLKKRLASYFRAPAQLSPKTRALVTHIATIDVTVTHTETEALLLENNLIKKHQPRYNILLRDDKSYPYIYLSADEFPRLSAHRGTKRAPGRYFGPYPSSGSIRDTLNLLQKVFPVRQCEDSFYRNRSRPCLQYQIKRCTAPCVGLISAADYQEDVQQAILFLEGKNNDVITRLVAHMQAAAAALEYEKAAHYRDRIARLKRLQERQYMDTDHKTDVDIIACLIRDNSVCVQLLSVRAGRHLGSKAFFPKQAEGESDSDILAAFMAQYYLGKTRDIPAEIIVNAAPAAADALRVALSAQRGTNIIINSQPRAAKKKWLEMAQANADISLSQRRPARYRERLSALALALGWETLPQRLECFDISHTQGERTVASCVVFDSDGPRRSDYRRYNIKDIRGGDDYAAMQQALNRRFAPKDTDETPVLPDILLIDGGAGQLAQARAVLTAYQLNEVFVLGIAKGEGRKAEFDHLVLAQGELSFPKDSPALHLLQEIRDEAHRFAITGHRQSRAKARTTSSLESIAGIGAKRRQALLAHFGGLQGVQRAGVEDLSAVPGIHHALAQKIYDVFHGAHC